MLLLTAVRMIWSYDDLTPLNLLLVPAWAGYTVQSRLGVVVLVLSALAIVPEMIVLKVEPYAGLPWWLARVFLLADRALARTPTAVAACVACGTS